MTMSKLKLGICVIVVAGIATILVIQHQAQTELTDENQSLRQQMTQLQNDNESLSNLVAQGNSSPSRPDDQLTELLRLRGEVRLLRQQVNETKQKIVPPTASSPEPAKLAGHRPGIYISKDQLVFAGYATPEAALESMTWAMMSGTYDQVNQSLPPEMLAEQLKNPKGREQFEAGQAKAATVMKGIQIVAKKVLADDKVELKVKSDYDPTVMKNLTSDLPPEYMVQPMVRVGNEWKIGGSTRGYRDGWENDGQIQTFVP
jgi:hypothetical protein